LRDLILAICARHRNGIKLDELAKKCWESGYQSTSQGKQFIQNIRTNLHNLMNSGVVKKDDEKRYHKNEPEGVPEVVAPVAAG
jgi:endonuclease I